MPYRRRYSRRGRRFGRRRRKNSKLTVYTRKSARSQARQIYKNQTQITAIAHKLKDTYTREFYELTGAEDNMVKPGAVFPLIKPVDWARIFNTQPEGGYLGHSTHARLGNIQIRGQMSIDGGDSVVSCDVFVLQAQKTTAGVVRDNLGASWENLMQKSMATNDAVWNNYYFNWYGSAALEGPYGLRLNPEAFKIRGHRRFMLSNTAESGTAIAPGAPVTNIKDANKPFMFNLNHPIKIKNPLGANTTGAGLTWKTLTVDQIKSDQQLYLACFVNAVEGTEVFLNWNATFSVKVPT